MKKVIALVLALTILASVAVFSVGAASRVDGLRQVGASSTSFEISWNEYFGATRYRVEYSNSPNGTYMNDTDYASTSLRETVYSVSPGNTYYVKITPYVDGKYVTSATSEPFIVATSPNNVTNLKQTGATTSSYTIKWTGSLGATKYAVYKYSNNTEKLIGTTTKTSYTVNGVSNKKDVDYSTYVRAIRNVNGYNAASGSEYLSSYTIDLIPAKPAAPTLSSVFESIGVVYFNSPSVKFQDGYEINVYKANKKKVFTSGTSYRYTGFKKGQFYKVKSRAWTKIGASSKEHYGAWSKFTYFVTGLKNATASGRNNSIRVSWSKVKGGKVKYDIKVSKSYNSGLKKFKKNFKGTSITVNKYGKKKLSRRTSYYIYIQPKIKVGKKWVKSPIMQYVSTYTK